MRRGGYSDWSFDWNDGNRAELARHRIQDFEAEQVIDNDPVWRMNKRGATGDYYVVGRTNGGRILTIVVLIRPDERVLRVITGWSSTNAERKTLGRLK